MRLPHSLNRMGFPRPLLPEEMPKLKGVRIPRDLYWVLQHPAPLAGMTYPSWDVPWRALHGSGFPHVVCLTHEEPEYDPSPLSLLFSMHLDDLVGLREPHDPRRERHGIERAARSVLARLRLGEGVIVHCAGGTGRTGTVIGAVLRLLGMSAEDVIRYLDEIHRRRGQDGWPESPWQASVIEEM